MCIRDRIRDIRQQDRQIAQRQPQQRRGRAPIQIDGKKHAQQQAEKVLHAFQPGVTAHPMRRPVKIQSDREQRPRQQRRQTR